MKKVLFALTVVVSLTAVNCFAQTIPASALSGFYVFQATGFDANDFGSGTPNTVHTGEVAVLGVLQFDGIGHFTGTLNFTSADSGGALEATPTRLFARRNSQGLMAHSV